MNGKKSNWVRVTRAEPCPICGKPNYCGRSSNGAVARCTRIESTKESNGRDGSIAWIHRLVDPLPNIATKEKPPKPTKAEWAQRAEHMFNAREATKGREELAGLLGVSVESLELLGVGVGHDFDGKRFWSFPERDLQWRQTGIKRRYADGSQKHMPGATPGLYAAREWWTYPGPILLPEGGSDVAALLTMGLCAVGRSSNTGSVSQLIGLLRGQERPVIVLGENDRKPERVGTAKESSKTAEGERLCARDCEGCSWCWPGKFGSIVTAERLTAALRRPIYSRMVNGAKDTRAWLKENGPDGAMFLESLKLPRKWLIYDRA